MRTGVHLDGYHYLGKDGLEDVEEGGGVLIRQGKGDRRQEKMVRDPKSEVQCPRSIWLCCVYCVVALLRGMSSGFKIVGPRARVSESKVLLAGMGVRRYIVRARVCGSMGDRE